MFNTEPYRVQWTYFTDYYKWCDSFAWRGACYAFVFNDTKPKEYQQPFQFEECIYIGESAGNYYDKQHGHKGHYRSLVHKRMTHHLAPLVRGEYVSRGFNLIKEKYGYGHNVLKGTLTGRPLWLGLLIPNPDIPDYLVKSWVMYEEARQILQYAYNFNKTPLGNTDRDATKDPDSYSSHVMGLNTLEDFMADAV